MGQYPVFRLDDSLFPGGRRNSVRDIFHIASFLSRELSSLGDPDAFVIGTTSGTALHFLEGYRAIQQGQASLPEDLADYFTSSLAFLSVPGPGIVLSNTCTSGADALALAADMIQSGSASCVLCGGVDTVGSVPHAGFSRLLVMARDAAKPFDRNRKGLSLGEAGALLLLEEEGHARKRGATILARLAGYAQFSDAYHCTAPHPDGRGLYRAVREALAMACVSAEAVAFVHAHGTATNENDRVEGMVLRSLLPNVPVWGSKGGTGHTLGASGALSAIGSIAALNAGFVPETPGFENLDEAIGFAPTTQALPISKDYALTTSLGFGGGNTALVFARGEL